ncbi:MAG: iron dependent repressor, metal binding and dimerization domain protein [Anaerolineales bacterium]|nr:MAG: iron dependent repressor, metal binding and dimerization domain protein [Anaerolineales bacterium]
MNLVWLLIFTVTIWVIFRPEQGAFWRWQRAQKLTTKVFQEDALKHIHQCEIDGDKPSIKSLAGALNTSPDEIAKILDTLASHELLEFQGTEFHLTSAGRDYALRIIRAHRLYERYLADETGYNETDWHDRAERFEHMLTTDEANALSARLGNPTHDPHGDPIPTASGQIFQVEHTPLTNMAINKPARIVHLEDEPEVVYAQLVAEGLHVGQVVRLLESSPQRVRFWAGGDEHLLAPVVAANIAVTPMPEMAQQVEVKGEALSSLKPGQTARVAQLSYRIRGAERRRLLDLGVLPGTKISNEMSSASGDPSAYCIRDAVIALRKSQADLIFINKQDEDTQ